MTHSPRIPAFFLAVILGVPPLSAQVLTYQNDNGRTGQNLTETSLTPSNVPVSFGKRFDLLVDGHVYAQPLYVPAVMITAQGHQGVHNVLYVVTENESIYAFDADDAVGQNATPLWQASAISPSANPAERVVTSSEVSCGDLVPIIGITSTPVAWPAENALYVVAKTVTTDGSTFHHRLHKLSLSSGLEMAGSPVETTATLPGNADGGTDVTFNPLRQHQRSALTLSQGIVYIASASHCDVDSPHYHGWVLGYNATTLQRTSAYVTTPNDPATEAEGGIWESGNGPAADAQGNLFFITGNGTFDTPNADFGDAVVKLSPSFNRTTPFGTELLTKDYFTPFDQASLDGGDVDFGSGGAVLLPDQPGKFPHLALACGKQGSIFVLNRDNLGKFDGDSGNLTDQDLVVQSFRNQIGGTWSSPAYFNGNVYYWGSGDVLTQFTFKGGFLESSPPCTAATVPCKGAAPVTVQGPDSVGFPGSTPAISANGATNGILWAIDSSAAGSGPAVLRAYAVPAPQTGFTKLYDSSAASSSDAPGVAVKFTVPTIARGRVYVPSQDRVSVYAANTIAFTAQSYTVSEGMGVATITLTRSEPVTGMSEVDVSTSDGLNSAGRYTPLVSHTVTFARGQASATFPIQIINDVVANGSGEVVLQLSNPVNAVLGTTGGAVLTILDNDAGGAVSFASPTASIAAPSAASPSKTLEVVLTRTGGLASGASVTVAAVGGSAAGNASYYTLPSPTATFAAGKASTLFPLTIVPDTKPPLATGTVQLQLQSPTGGAVLGARTTMTITIAEADPVATFSPAAISALETATDVPVHIVRTGDVSQSANVIVIDTGTGTARAGINYVSIVPGLVPFAAGSAQATFHLTPIHDGVFGPAKTVVLGLSTGVPVGVAVSPNRATVTLQNVDPGAVFHMTVPSLSVSRVSLVTTANVVVHRSGNLAAMSVPIVAADGTTAVLNQDYTLPGAGSYPFAVPFALNQTIATVPLTITWSGTPVPDKQIVLLLQTPGAPGGTITAPTSTTVHLVEGYSTSSFSAAGYFVNEMAHSIQIPVVRTLPANVAGSVDVLFGGGVGPNLAVPGVNYVAPPTNPVTVHFAAGQTMAFLAIDTLEANLGSTVLNLALQNPTPPTAGIGRTPAAGLTIVDTSAEEGTLEFGLKEYTTEAAAGTASVIVTRKGGVGTAVVTCSTSDGTAIGGTDYTAISQTLTFGPGVTTRTCQIPILKVEPGPTYLNLTLSPTGAGVIGSPATALLWIVP